MQENMYVLSIEMEDFRHGRTKQRRNKTRRNKTKIPIILYTALVFQKRRTDKRKRLISSHKRKLGWFGPVCALNSANNEKRCLLSVTLLVCGIFNDTVLSLE